MHNHGCDKNVLRSDGLHQRGCRTFHSHKTEKCRQHKRGMHLYSRDSKLLDVALNVMVADRNMADTVPEITQG